MSSPISRSKSGRWATSRSSNGLSSRYLGSRFGCGPVQIPNPKTWFQTSKFPDSVWYYQGSEFPLLYVSLLFLLFPSLIFLSLVFFFFSLFSFLFSFFRAKLQWSRKNGKKKDENRKMKTPVYDGEGGKISPSCPIWESTLGVSMLLKKLLWDASCYQLCCGNCSWPAVSWSRSF